MRPVVKPSVGETVNIDGVGHVVQETYQPYQDAKPVLVEALGKYCSYCECYHDEVRSLHVEHTQPKGLLKYGHLAYSWDNFLLACSTCNGKDNKADKDVVYGECHLPHLNNTFLSLVYRPGGVVMANPSLRGVSRSNAQYLLELVGLDKSPRESSPTDKRWASRGEVWALAQRYLSKYKSGSVGVDVITDLVKARGYWSIWFTVFDGIDEVRKALIEDFPGTCADCFDPSNHYAPVPRNPGQADVV